MKTRGIRRRSRGFTLMEVLLVLAILVILSGLAAVAINRAAVQANKRTAKIQIEVYAKAASLYYIDVGQYPESLGDLQIEPANLPANKWGGPYLDKEIQTDPWGREYTYEIVQENEKGDVAPRIASAGPNGSPGDNDDIANR